MSDLVPENQVTALLLADLRQLIDEARRRVATTVNFEQTLLYWRVGARSHQDVLHNERAGYGKPIVATLSRQLAAEYGKGFDRANLFCMLQFAELFPDEQIVSTLSSQCCRLDL